MSSWQHDEQEKQYWNEITEGGKSYNEEDWHSRLNRSWVPMAGESRADHEIFPQKPRPTVHQKAEIQARIRANGRCEICNQKGQPFGRALETHHLHYRTVGNESLWDLAILCRECHKRQHADGDTWWNDTEQLAALDWVFRESYSKGD